MTELTSSANATYKTFLSLTTGRGIKKESLFLLSGKDLIAEFLKKPTLEIECEIVAPGKKPISKAKAFSLSAKLFSPLDVLGTGENMLVLHVPENSPWKPYAKKGLSVLLPLGDPGNLGAVLRSCEAFGADEIVLLKESANPFLPKSVKASAGSVLRLALFSGPSIHDLDPNNLIALDMQGTPLSTFRWPETAHFLVGEEGPGLPPHLRKNAQTLKIETKSVESLNATVAASIALYAYSLSTR